MNTGATGLLQLFFVWLCTAYNIRRDELREENIQRSVEMHRSVVSRCYLKTIKFPKFVVSSTVMHLSTELIALGQFNRIANMNFS